MFNLPVVLIWLLVEFEVKDGTVLDCGLPFSDSLAFRPVNLFQIESRRPCAGVVVVGGTDIVVGFGGEFPLGICGIEIPFEPVPFEGNCAGEAPAIFPLISVFGGSIFEFKFALMAFDGAGFGGSGWIWG
jgi:hypothetical protein